MKTPEDMAQAIRERFMHLKRRGIYTDFYMLLLDEVARHYMSIQDSGVDVDEIIAEVSVILTERSPNSPHSAPKKRRIYH